MLNRPPPPKNLSPHTLKGQNIYQLPNGCLDPASLPLDLLVHVLILMNVSKRPAKGCWRSFTYVELLITLQLHYANIWAIQTMTIKDVQIAVQWLRTGGKKLSLVDPWPTRVWDRVNDIGAKGRKRYVQTMYDQLHRAEALGFGQDQRPTLAIREDARVLLINDPYILFWPN